MSLQLAAQHLASRGRGPDTQLIHMAPQEVAGLQALAKAHGGSLTTNPDTGLPEAGFLSSILPMVIGAGLSVASGGTLTPLMAAGLTGAAGTLATGSLKKGLMAGLGAYGGAGLAGGLMGAGAAGAGAAGAGASEMAATQAALQQNALAGIGVDSATAAGTGSMSFAPGMSTNVLGTTPTAGPMSVPLTAPIQAQQAVVSAAPQTVTQMAPTFSDNLSQMGRGIESLGTQQGRDALLTKENLRYGLAGLAPVTADMMAPKPLAARESVKPYEYDFSYGRAQDPQAGYTGAYTGERAHFNPTFTRRAAEGGLMGVAPVEQDPYYTMSGQSGDAFKYLMGQGPRPAAPTQAPAAAGSAAQAAPQTPSDASGAVMRPYTFDPATGAFTAMPVVMPAKTTLPPMMYYDGPGGGGFGGDSGGGGGSTSVSSGEGGGMGNSGEGGGAPGEGGWAAGGIASLAQGGQGHLGDYSDGGRLLRGPGDGVSDDIPASIGGKQPARLADGEFVVSADVVSGLGNGSTEAGARKLYAMMDRVREARTGTKKMGKTVNPDKLVPV